VEDDTQSAHSEDSDIDPAAPLDIMTRLAGGSADVEAILRAFFGSRRHAHESRRNDYRHL
jgi:hypothetical protein